MKNKMYLFPYYFRIIGFITLPILLITGWYIDSMRGLANIVANVTRNMNDPNAVWTNQLHFLFKNYGDEYIDEIFIVVVTFLSLFIAFSKEKVEDEYVAKIRLESLIWAFMVNAALIIIATLLLFKMDYVIFMALNFYLTLALFIVKFRIAIFISKKSNQNEK
ncbi:MAG: hypothetical protein LBV43_13430 [Prevotella sp.]|jgi:hypothetical protein|nr:hypothetical protein [Prevotella sp.]